MPKASLNFAKRNFKLPALALIALFISTFSQVSGQTGSDARARAQELLKQGDLQGAIELLRAAVKNDKADDDTWHALGLAYGLARETENSASAFKTAATLRLNRLAAGTPRATPSDQPGHVSAEFAQRYKAVVDSIERYIAASSNADVSVTADLDALRFYRDYYSGLRTDERIVAAREATKRLRVLSKPPPVFLGVVPRVWLCFAPYSRLMVQSNTLWLFGTLSRFSIRPVAKLPNESGSHLLSRMDRRFPRSFS